VHIAYSRHNTDLGSVSCGPKDHDDLALFLKAIFFGTETETLASRVQQLECVWGSFGMILSSVIFMSKKGYQTKSTERMLVTRLAPLECMEDGRFRIENDDERDEYEHLISSH